MGACGSSNNNKQSPTSHSNHQKTHQIKQNNNNHNFKSKKPNEVNLNDINIELNKDDNDLNNKNQYKKNKLNEEEQKKYYLICPDCKVRNPYIDNIIFDKDENIIKIKFQCICEKEMKEVSINDMIIENKPTNLCPFHQSNLNLFCSTCKYFICQYCKSEHEEHNIIDNNDYNDCDIDNLIKNVSIKELEFENQCNSCEKDFENNINKEINKLNQIKENYKKSFNEEKQNKTKLFKMLNTLFLEYKNLKNNSNNNININNNILSNQLENFDLKENTSNEILTSNTNEIIPNIQFPSIPLHLNYPLDFKKLDEKNKKYECIKTLYGHNNKIVTLIRLNSGNLASGSYDNTIKIWDLKENECKLTIEEDGYILCLLEFIPNYILAGLSDNKIKLYKINENYEFIYSFEEHQLWVNCLVKIDNEKFASGSNDTTIKIWDYINKEVIYTLTGHTDCILSLIKLKNNNLCSGAADNTIRIWSYEKYECLNILYGHEKWVKCLLQLDNGLILSGSDDNTIKVWDNENCIHTLNEHQHSVRTICQINKEKFASGSFDATIKIWDIESFNCEQTLEGHNSNVIGIVMLNNRTIASCSNDATIKIWN